MGYYLQAKKMFNNLDFIAELKFKPTKKGGRKSYVANGYKPHIKF